MVQCGDTFTVAGTSENTIYFWGSRQVLLLPQLKKNDVTNTTSKKDSRTLDRRRSSGSVSVISETSVSDVIKIGNLLLKFIKVILYIKSYELSIQLCGYFYKKNPYAYIFFMYTMQYV